ncbi:hypothetical protein ACU639_01490 [Streptomyces cynarae]
MTVLIIGGSGFLGTELVRQATPGSAALTSSWAETAAFEAEIAAAGQGA